MIPLNWEWRPIQSFPEDNFAKNDERGWLALPSFFVSSIPWFRCKSMKLISSNKIGIQSGTFTMFSDFDKAGETWVGTGSRERHKRITFKEKFVSPPSVT